MGDREAVQRFAVPGRLPAIGKPATGGSPNTFPDKSAHQPSTWMRRTVHIAGKIEPFFGTLDENVRFLEDALHVRTHLHDTKLTIEGGHEDVDQAARIVEEYNHAASHGRHLTGEEVKSLMRVVLDAPHESPRGMFEAGKQRAFGKKQVTPKNASQRRYMEEIEAHDMVFGIGPGGTGKTYIAVAMAVSALLTKQVNRIILARPAVEAGEKLGFLPGTLQEKVDPYMRPLYDALYEMLDADKLESFLEKGIIEIAPLAFMRGRTLNDSFVILDEAQNTTSEQMKMFLTRLGFNSKAVITGDITQIDLPAGKKSGLVEALEIVGKIEGIGAVQFNEKDVVRHNLVQRIIRAYEEYEADHPHRGGNGKLGAVKPDGQ
jgi:phosphate starvation-inducible PhoH-like protein